MNVVNKIQAGGIWKVILTPEYVLVFSTNGQKRTYGLRSVVSERGFSGNGSSELVSVGVNGERR